MDSIPEESKWRSKKDQGRPNTAEQQIKNGLLVRKSPKLGLKTTVSQEPVVVKVLNRVHGEPGKRLDVGVPVMESVDILVHCLDVDEPVGKVEVELAVEGNPEGREDEHCRVPRAREGLARRSRKMLF